MPTQPMNEDTKLAKIRKAMEDDDWDLALRIAAGFVRLGAHKKAIERAAEALANPTLYQQMGYDIKQLREDGINALKERFSKSWEQVQRRKEDT